MIRFLSDVFVRLGIYLYSGQRVGMIFFRTAVIVAGLFLACTLVVTQSFLVQAEETASKDVDIAAAVKAIQPAEGVSAKKSVKDKKKTTVKRKKGRKKGAAKKTSKAIIEEKLTINQVMDILKTTRDLSGKDLSGLKLVGINLSKCNLRGVNLSNATLERADLGESDLERADLTGANLKMANLRLSGLTGANLERAILDGAIWKDGRVCDTGSIGQCLELTVPLFGR